MPGVRGKNLRSGDLAETLALTILQSVALVTPVPRTEDVGIDAVLTLLRDFDGKRYLAEDSCFVQIKSASVESIEFEGEGVQWLFALELPLFFASVDRKSARLKLYCAHRLGDAFISSHTRTQLIIRFDTPSQDFIDKADPTILVGPPVLEWSINDDTVNENFYHVMKAHIRIAKLNLATRRVGYIVPVAWETNQLIRSGGAISSGKPLDDVDDVIAPYMTTWIHQLVVNGWTVHAESLLKLLQKMRPADYIPNLREYFDENSTFSEVAEAIFGLNPPLDDPVYLRLKKSFEEAESSKSEQKK